MSVVQVLGKTTQNNKLIKRFLCIRKSIKRFRRMNYFRFVILICLSLLSIDGYTQGQTRHHTTQNASRRTKTSSNKVNRKKGYVDLGLPSGTLWKDTNESGFYDYDKAKKTYGRRLPSQEQWAELKNYCKWSWNGCGYQVMGDNGYYISIPAEGYLYCSGDVDDVGISGNYWSSSPDGSLDAWGFCLSSDGMNIRCYTRGLGLSVRLVQNK